ncbi:response regulator [Fusibacter ferrireducens]|uniref:Stage 0 sporulation protein A homolog n=1 Tax=Fusibacter ferrireducens TaxID=2785058 RepID=A0ABR9ZWH4_9FIRM|nr:response regulator [Fusibacter ferrireducens]MBF4694827.1 response regulator [Fusibacter ferrireducens]
MKGYCLVNSQSLRRHLHAYFETFNIEHLFIEVETIFETNFRKQLPDFIAIELEQHIVDPVKLNRLMKTLFSDPVDVIVLTSESSTSFDDIEKGFFKINIKTSEELSDGFKTYLSIKNLYMQEKLTKENDISALKRILFVDDSQLQQKQIKMIFKNTGYHIVFASNGVEALKMIEQTMPSLVITDIHMPEMDGYTLCKKIREKYRDSDLPIIVTTSTVEESTLQKTYQMGADDFIPKPITEDKLINKVNRYFDTKNRHEKILVVDDSLMIQNVLKLGIMRNGYHVLVASDGKEGLETAIREKPDVIISDIYMPIMDGYEMIAAIRNTPEIKHTPCIIMSSTDGKYNQKLAESLGVEKYFVKPFQLDYVLHQIEYYIVEKYKEYMMENKYMLSTINSLIKALEERDSGTKGHTERVTIFSGKIAEQLNLPKEEIEKIIMAAKLHDIGKIGIKDSILLKNEELTAAEYQIIKDHCKMGWGILAPIKSLDSILPMIYHHHERYDGHGYPDGLEGEAIPLGARIIAVADTFDAIISDRPYRKGRSVKIASEIIEENIHKQFCPVAAKAFLEVLKSLKEI